MTDVVTTSAAAALAEPAASAPPAAPGVAAPAAPGSVPPVAAPAATPAPPALTLPGKDADATAWKAFYKAIGAPENADGYTLPVPEGADPAFAKEAAATMAEVGLMPHQAAKLAEWWNSKAASATEAQKNAATEAAKARDATAKTEEASLKNEWQSNYDANIEAGKRAVRQFFPQDKAPAAIEALEGALGFAGTMKLMASLGKGLAEGTARGLDGSVGAAAARDPAQVLYGSKN